MDVEPKLGPNTGNRGKGRPKGVPNKVGAAAKEVIAQAAADLGGVGRLVDWAKEAPENERAFWATIYPKLIPVQVSGDKENPVAITVTTGVPRDDANH